MEGFSSVKVGDETVSVHSSCYLCWGCDAGLAGPRGCVMGHAPAGAGVVGRSEVGLWCAACCAALQGFVAMRSPPPAKRE